MAATITMALFAKNVFAGGSGVTAVIPQPDFIEIGEGTFELLPSTKILGTRDAMVAAKLLQTLLSRSTGFALTIEEVESSVPSSGSILVSTLGTQRLHENESYELLVTGKHVLIRANDAAGAFYGVQTLRQLLPPQIEKQVPESGVRWTIPTATVRDLPRFRWRGMHLDVGRQYFPVAFIKRYIDLMALHKLNVFHWHLTDDQGWRIEIKRYPLLTDVGALRWGTRQRSPPTSLNRSSSGYYYTQDEIREVVTYARERSITVVPEIDIPGHSLAILASYPKLGCTGGPYEVTGAARVETEVLCAGNEDVYTFLEDVFDEVLDLFPSDYIHIGGDEVPHDRWHACPRCQARMQGEGLKSETELQAYFTNRLRTMLHARGRRVIGWDEIRDGAIPKDVAMMAWRSLGEAAASANEGYDVVVCTAYSTYFNVQQTPAYISLERVYRFDPIPPSVTGQNKLKILGTQGCLWCESVTTPEEAEELILPRMSALAEVAWSRPENSNWPDFQRRVSVLKRRFETIGLDFYNPPYLVELYLFLGKRRIAMILALCLLPVVAMVMLRSRTNRPNGCDRTK